MKIKLNERTLAAIAAPDNVPQLVVWDVELTGFGVVVGKQNRTFIAETRVDGKKRRKAIGVAGRIREDGHPWTVQLARIEARKLLGDMARGIDPNAERRLRREGPTLRDALDLHVSKMRKNDARPRSVDAVEHETEKHLRKLARPAARGDLAHRCSRAPRGADRGERRVPREPRDAPPARRLEHARQGA